MRATITKDGFLKCGVKLSPKETHMSENTVLYEAHGSVAKLTLNRPQALNSFTRRMHQDLWAGSGYC
jgi:1,4-dihydroxy-2-naphthoyl-CoA synthase